MQRDVFIEWDLESTPLEVRTDNVLESNEVVYVTFFSASKTYAGRVELITSTLQYHLHTCTTTWTILPVTPPSVADKVWRITLTKTAGVRLMIHCNDVEVLNKLFSDATCSNSEWSKYWNNDVTMIKFYSGDTASDYYRAGD